jgi:regulator of RNase E activity RraA
METILMKNQSTASEASDVALFARLKELDTSAVSDALDRLNLTGVVLGLSGLSTPRRIVGMAITVELGNADGRSTSRHLCTQAVDACGPGTVIVIAHNGRVDVAGWGGILSLGATVRGAEGIVIDGACRDLDESQELGLCIYGRSAVPITARGRIIETAWNSPVTFGGVRVSPGDLVIADASGVVFLPRERAEEIIQIAEGVRQRERAMSDAVRSGLSMIEVMGGNYENMLTNRVES